MTVRFSTEAARRELTPVDNLFISEYMSEAEGSAVKVYLYGLMQCLYTAYAETDIGFALGLNKEQVLSAFVYWQSRGLVRITGEDPLTVEYLTVEQPAVTTATPVKYAGFVSSLHTLTAPRTFTLREMKHVYDCMETFRLEEGAVLELISHCMETKGRNVSIQYVMTVAQSWAEKGLVTAADARAYIAELKVKKHGAAEVLRRWNKRRQPTQDEMELYEKWQRDWGFDEEAILAACPLLTGVSTPTFEALGERLETLYAQGNTDKSAIEAQSGFVSSEKEFARMVFARMGKVEAPTATQAAQLGIFMSGDNALSREVVLAAADLCLDAERPFGKLKTILRDWSEKGVKTPEDAEKYKEPPENKRSSRRATPYAGFQQRSADSINIDDITLDLD